jgi:hypothetical protein
MSIRPHLKHNEADSTDRAYFSIDPTVHVGPIGPIRPITQSLIDITGEKWKLNTTQVWILKR